MPRKSSARRISIVGLALFGSARLAVAGPQVSLELRVSGFSAPVQVTHSGDGSGRLFVVEQGGRIRVIDGATTLAAPFLDISSLITAGGERGLLGLAFHPDYESNGFFYVNYTDRFGSTVVARYTVSPDPARADPTSGATLLTVNQAFANHNGGQLLFSPLDGYLYIGMGDGGSGGDPFGHGQNRDTLLGDMLRIDVDGGFPYAIPPTNPFVGTAGADEIWATGLRNPWRFSFDRETGDLYIGDVGQGTFEEINYQAAGTPGGLNFGWAVREGPCGFGQASTCAAAPPQFTDPVAFYGRSAGSSVTGGFVYRGELNPGLVGRYFFGDFVSGRIWSIEKIGTNPDRWSIPELRLQAGFFISAFGESEEGELYVVDYFGGRILRLKETIPPPVITDTELPEGRLGLPYSERVPVAGGTPPLAFALVSGTLAPGLTGPDPMTGIVSGTPVQPGSFGPAVIRVTDAVGLFDEEALTHTITLAPPEPLRPLGAVNETTPTFEWSASPGATSYRLVVDNADGSSVIDQAGIASTSSTPGAPLAAGELYDWRVQATDGVHSSPFSPTVRFEVDLIPPGAVTTLAGTTPSPVAPLAGLSAVSVSAELPPHVRGRTVDGDWNTLWSTPPRLPMTPEQITIDLGVETLVSRVSLRSREALGSLLPRDFEIQLSHDGVHFSTVHSVFDFSAPDSPAAWYAFDFPPALGHYVRLEVTESTQHTDGKHYVQVSEIEVWSAVSPGSVAVSWLAPGDDGGTGTSFSYDVRFLEGTGPNLDYDNAIDAAGEPAPRVAGSPERFLLTGLASETTYAVALKSTDDAGNVSDVSNTAIVLSSGSPPGPVTDLASSSLTESSILLSWTATGDDGSIGTAASYDVRRSPEPLDGSNFSSAAEVVGEPAPLGSGTPQSVTVGSLAPDTVYHFGLKVKDDVGNVSLLSNVTSAATLDIVPPAPIEDLTIAQSFVATPLAAVAVDASGELSPHVKGRATDGNPATLWSTPGRPTMENEHITLDLGASLLVMRIRLRSRDMLGNLMPRDFEIQLGDNVDGPFATALTVVDFEAPITPAAWFAFDFAPAQGRFLRVHVTETNAFAGLFYLQVSEIEVEQALIQADRARLTWTSTGDNGLVGTAASYDLRYSAGAFDFDTATPLVGEPVPNPAGSVESFTAMGLPGESTIVFGIKACDEAHNCSTISKLPVISTPPIPPAAIEDLAAGQPTGTSLRLTFTTSGDDGLSGTASAYDVRYRTSGPISTEADFAIATQVADEPAPLPGGSPHAILVSNLTPETTYYFAMKVADDLGVGSPLSNPASATTLDVLPPNAILDLSASPGYTSELHAATAIDSSGELAPHAAARLVDRRLDTLWSTPGRPAMQAEHVTFDLGATTLVGRVRLHPRNLLGNLMPRAFQIQLADDPGGPFTSAALIEDFTAPASPTAWFAFDFAPAAGRYLKIQITETNSVGGLFFVQIAEVEIYRAVIQSDRTLLTWTSTGDNGSFGTAASYDLRYSAAQPFDFDNATRVLNEPAPEPSGSPQTLTAFDLPGESTIHFGIKACDEVDNCSPLSNLPSIVTPPVPPTSVENLTAGNPTGTSVELTFTAPGDDGSSGLASAYDVRYRTSGSILTDADFAGASEAVNEPPPLSGGSFQQIVVSGLTSETTYYFALKAVDDAGASSSLSNPASATTLDVLPPSPVVDLAASAGALLSPTAAAPMDSSGELSPHVIGRLVDQNFNTAWSTPGRAVMQDEHVTFDLGSTMLVGRVSLRSREALGSLMPRDFEIQLGENPGGPFAVAATIRDFSAPASPADWFRFDFAPAKGRYLKIRITETNAVAGLFYVQMTEVEVHRATMQNDQALLHWTAPGDNASMGTAARYDLRYRMNASIGSDVDFEAATPVPGVPAPRTGGTRETFVVRNLAPETHYFFAVKTVDDAGNSSALSNVPSLITPAAPPARVTTLVAGSPTSSSVRLDWVATGDDGMVGTASAYDIRFSTTNIASDADFTDATPATGEPPPSVAGTPQFLVVDGLLLDTTYFFAAKVMDDVGAVSPLSNVASAKTLDIAPPATVFDLAASPGFDVMKQSATVTSASGELPPHVAARAVDSNLGTIWSTPGRFPMQNEEMVLDLGASFPIARVRLRSREGLGNLLPRDFQIQLATKAAGPFITAANIEDFAAAVSPAAWYEFDFPPATGRYVKLQITETNSVSGLFFVQVNEIEVYRAVPRNDRVTLAWTSTGDNGPAGRAALYDIRYGTAQPFDFATATASAGEPSPRPAGEAETFSIGGLAPDTTYFFALQVRDEAGQASGISNVVTLTTPP